MKKIIGIDFDGTCVTDLYPYVGDNIGAASVLRKLADRNLLILYTVRDGRYLQDAVDWFKYNHINLYSVNYNPEPVSSSPKLYCDYYIDEENKIVYDTILMIGDASGKEGQFSDSDKKTAENFGCEYMDVDDFVDKYKG